jgi:hypothetical protein
MLDPRAQCSFSWKGGLIGVRDQNTHDSAGVTSDQHSLGKLALDDSTGTNGGSTTDPSARKNHSAGSDKHIVTDDDFIRRACDR